jgi:hypothetical protein
MPKRSRTGQPDANQMAANLIGTIIGELPVEQSDPNENPASRRARQVGGGLKGGKARADRLSAPKQIAKEAAKARWSGQ